MRFLASIALIVALVIAGTVITQAQPEVWGEDTKTTLREDAEWVPAPLSGGYWYYPSDGQMVGYNHDPAPPPRDTTTDGPWTQPTGINDFGKVASQSGNVMNFDNTTAKTIADFYAMGGTINNTNGTLAITNLWATAANNGNAKGTGDDVSVDTYNLVVGEKRDFATVVGNKVTLGTPGKTLNSLILSQNDVVTNGTSMHEWGMTDDTKINVENYGTINTVVQYTNTLNNYADSEIDNLTYYGGTFNDFGGSIGNLTIVGDASGIGWGNVGNLAFSGDGNGMMTITGFVDGFDIRVSDSIDFLGYKTLNLNLSAMLIASEFTDFDDWIVGFVRKYGVKLVEEDLFVFSFGTLFGLASNAIKGLQDILAINVDWGGADTVSLNADAWNDGILFTVTSGDSGNGSGGGDGGGGDGSVPEPATFVVFSLGLAGVGLASRRRRK